MDVQLYVYDLSGGMARQFSMMLAGVQIDAIYHTAIVFGGVEYFFGQGIHRKVPGTTHHGQPMKIIELGKTQLPNEVIREYIQSLEAIYTPESYDLFMHNCNNFSQDMAVFLVGREIPEEIRKLPETFLNTPMGQMLRGQLDQSMRQMTQAPDANAGQNVQQAAHASAINGNKPVSTNTPAVPRTPVPTIGFLNGQEPVTVPGRVHNISNSREVDKLLRQAESTSACLFFTSASCPPCKLVYPAYDELADEAGDKVTLIKVDTNAGYDLASRYQIRATPTFITFLKGKKQDEWSGANEAQLRGNIRLLMYMANPQHAHTGLRLPSLQSRIQKPIMYTRVPPLDKLLAKIGPASNDRAVQDLVSYIRLREKEGLENAPIPNLHAFSEWISSIFKTAPVDTHFAIVDLVRVAAIDPRISSYLASEPSLTTLSTIIPPEKDYSTAAYNLQATTLQLVNNLFSSTIFQELLLYVKPPTTNGASSSHSHPQSKSIRSEFLATIESLVSTCLLSDHHNTRTLAAIAVYNIVAPVHNHRLSTSPSTTSTSSQFSALPTSIDIEAALVQSLIQESENKDTLHALLLSLGGMLYCAPTTSESGSGIWDLCLAMDVKMSLGDKFKMPVFKDERGLILEVGEELLGKGVRGD